MGTRVRLEAEARSIGDHPRIAYEFDPGPGVAGGPQWLPQWTAVSRNARCPCGSGRKYKRCHGTLA